MNVRNLGVMPRETKLALLLLWAAFLGGLAIALLVTAQNWAAVSAQPAGWWIKAFGAYPVSTALIFALGRGYGWLRWLFLIGILLFVVFLFINVGAWARNAHGLAMFALAEPLFILLRVAAVAPLFRATSNNWYAGCNAPVN